MGYSEQHLLEIDSVELSFGDRRILSGVYLAVETGGVTAVLGRNGCGKSCLMKILCGSLRADFRSMRIDGVWHAHFRADEVRYLTQQGFIPGWMSVDRVLRDFGLPWDDLLAWFPLFGDLHDTKIHSMSGGERRLLECYLILRSPAQFVMLDEPFSALDAHLKSVLEQNLVSLFDAFDGTILYVSHDIDEALRFCDRIAVVEDGHVMEIGTGDDLVNNPQSQAGIKLSGCKNATRAEYVDAHHVRLPRWGITVETSREVSREVKCLGVRAFYLEQVDGPGENVYRARVDRVSDSRFERTALLGFVDACRDEREILDRNEDEMKYLHQHMFWRVDKLRADEASLPSEGEELWIRIPKDRVYLVSR